MFWIYLFYVSCHGLKVKGYDLSPLSSSPRHHRTAPLSVDILSHFLSIFFHGSPNILLLLKTLEVLILMLPKMSLRFFFLQKRVIQSVLPLCNIKLKQVDNKSMIARNVWIHVFIYSSCNIVGYCVHKKYGWHFTGKGYRENNEMAWKTLYTENLTFCAENIITRRFRW